MGLWNMASLFNRLVSYFERDNTFMKHFQWQLQTGLHSTKWSAVFLAISPTHKQPLAIHTFSFMKNWHYGLPRCEKQLIICINDMKHKYNNKWFQ